MALKGKGRGSILSTAEGQGSNRLRLDSCSLIEGVDTSGFTLPTAGNLYNYEYVQPDNQQLLDDVPDTADIYEEIQNMNELPAGASNRGKLVRVYINDDGTMIAFSSVGKAEGYVYQETNGQDFFRVTDPRSSHAVTYDAAAASPMQYAFSKIEDVSQDEPNRTEVDSVSFESCSGDQPACPTFSVLFDEVNGTMDSDAWAWNEV